MDKFKGYPYPIIKAPGGFFAASNGVDQIKADLLILLLTYPGERCFTGDTQVSLTNGTEVPIRDLVGRDPFWVYSYDHESKKILAGKATAHKTVINAELMEIELDNGEKVRCTPEHLWMLRDGTYQRADKLSVGDSLMPLYRSVNTSGYERVYQPYLGDCRETHLCTVHGTRLAGEREVVHHKDLNKRNNDPDNLRWMTCEDHKTLHKEINNAFINKINDDPEFKSNWIGKLKDGLKKYYETHGGHRKDVKLSDETKKKLSKNKKEFYDSKRGEETKKELRQVALKQHQDKGSQTLGRKHTEEEKKKMRGPRKSMAGENNPSKRPDVREKLKEAWVRRRQKNHKVVNIRHLGEREDCFDLHVEQYHNFALTAGVFVHNCMLPDFGTPLRDLLFDPNDATLAARARQMIIASIQKWEPRIAVDAVQVSTGADRMELDPDDDLTQVDAILSIKVSFRDPENISEVQDLSLEVPLQ